MHYFRLKHGVQLFAFIRRYWPTSHFKNFSAETAFASDNIERLFE